MQVIVVIEHIDVLENYIDNRRILEILAETANGNSIPAMAGDLEHVRRELPWYSANLHSGHKYCRSEV